MVTVVGVGMATRDAAGVGVGTGIKEGSGEDVGVTAVRSVVTFPIVITSSA